MFGIRKMDIFGDSILSTIQLALNGNLHNNYFFMVGWFLLSYMLVLSFAYPTLKLLSKLEARVSKLVILILALSIGYLAIEYYSPIYQSSKQQEINLLSQVLAGSMFFYLGFALKDYIWKMLNPITAYILFLFFVYLKQEKILTFITIMSWSKYPHGLLLTLAAALIGIYIVIFVADMLSKYYNGGGTFDLLRLIGQNSKPIMIFHLLSFTLVDVFFAELDLFTINPNSVGAHIKMSWAFPLNLVVSLFFSLSLGLLLKKYLPKIYG